MRNLDSCEIHTKSMTNSQNFSKFRSSTIIFLLKPTKSDLWVKKLFCLRWYTYIISYFTFSIKFSFFFRVNFVCLFLLFLFSFSLLYLLSPTLKVRTLRYNKLPLLDSFLHVLHTRRILYLEHFKGVQHYHSAVAPDYSNLVFF